LNAENEDPQKSKAKSDQLEKRYTVRPKEEGGVGCRPIDPSIFIFDM